MAVHLAIALLYVFDDALKHLDVKSNWLGKQSCGS